MPTTWHASLFWDTARIALPVFVFWTKKWRATKTATARRMMISRWYVMATPRTVRLWLAAATLMVRGLGVQRRIAPFCAMIETPRVARMGSCQAFPMSGRIASRSTTSPTRVIPAIAATIPTG
jgi:hypothetical protein